MAGLALKRGDIVRVADGKPRPAVIVQWDELITPTMILLCPLTSWVIEAAIYRPTVVPDPTNGLRAVSQIMVDRMGATHRDLIDGVIGRLGDEDILRLNIALTVTLDLGG